MKWSEFWEVASFCARHPSMILRNHWGNRREAQKIDYLIDVLVENKKRVRIVNSTDHKLILEFEGNFYCFWIANKFYDYLTSGKCSSTEYDASFLSISPDWDGILPSRLRAIRFFKTFDLRVEKKSGSRIPKSCLLLPSKKSDDPFYNHPDEITARKYVAGDPETLRRLGIFD